VSVIIMGSISKVRLGPMVRWWIVII